MAFPNISPALNGVSSAESRWLAQELMVRHRSNQAERTPFFRARTAPAMVSKNEEPRHASGDVGHDGAAGELFVKGGWGESAGGYS